MLLLVVVNVVKEVVVMMVLMVVVMVVQVVVLMVVLMVVLVLMRVLVVVLLRVDIAAAGCIVAGPTVTTPGNAPRCGVITQAMVVVVLVSVDGVVVVGFGIELSPNDSASRYTNSSFVMVPSPLMSTNLNVSRAMASSPSMLMSGRPNSCCSPVDGCFASTS